MRLPPHRFCNAVYAWLVARVEDREKFDYQLEAPGPGEQATDSDVQAEMEAFAALTSALGTG